MSEPVPVQEEDVINPRSTNLPIPEQVVPVVGIQNFGGGFLSGLDTLETDSDKISSLERMGQNLAKSHLSSMSPRQEEKDLHVNHSLQALHERRSRMDAAQLEDNENDASTVEDEELDGPSGGKYKALLDSISPGESSKLEEAVFTDVNMELFEQGDEDNPIRSEAQNVKDCYDIRHGGAGFFQRKHELHRTNSHLTGPLTYPKEFDPRSEDKMKKYSTSGQKVVGPPTAAGAAGTGTADGAGGIADAEKMALQHRNEMHSTSTEEMRANSR
jgi:hypothetical protein